MKIEDINVGVEGLVAKLKDGNMQRYIDEVVSIRYMPLRHNNNRKEDCYVVPLHEREGMLYGNVLYIEYIGEIMEEKFGHNYRAKSLYATFFGDKQYGDESYIVLPFGGDYDFCYSPEVHDMYHEVPRIKNVAFDVIYKEAKEGEYGSKDILSIIDKMEYDIVQEMRLPLSAYTEYLSKNGVSPEVTSKIVNRFESIVLSEYNKLIGDYKKTDSLAKTYSDIGKMYHPMIEVMVKAPKFLLVSYNYIMKKYGDVDYFFDAIKWR